MTIPPLNGKAYITIRNKNNRKEHMVTIEGKTVIMDSITSSKFINNASTNAYLGAYRVQLPDKSIFNLTTIDEDDRGVFFNFTTNNVNAVDNIIRFRPNISFNVFGLGSFHVSYGERYDTLLSKKIPRLFLLLLLKRVLNKRRTIDLRMTYS